MTEAPAFELKRNKDGSFSTNVSGKVTHGLTLDQGVRAVKAYQESPIVTFQRQYTIEFRQTATAAEFEALKEEVISAAVSLQKEGRQVLAFSDDFFEGYQEIYARKEAITKK